MAYTIEMCEEIYGNGFADEVSGDVEAPTGHFYRVHNCVVVTNSNGFSDLTEYPNESEAIGAFEALDESYSAWCDDDD